MIDQIREDHANAQLLADGIISITGLTVDRENIKSNILYFDIKKGRIRRKKLSSQTTNKDQYPFDINLNNIYFLETSPSRFRLVTHYGITKEDVEITLEVLKEMVK